MTLNSTIVVSFYLSVVNNKLDQQHHLVTKKKEERRSLWIPLHNGAKIIFILRQFLLNLIFFNRYSLLVSFGELQMYFISYDNHLFLCYG